MRERGRAEEPPQVERHPDARAQEQHGTSWTGVIYGWLAALGAALILSGIVGAILGALGVQGSARGGGILGSPARPTLRAIVSGMLGNMGFPGSGSRGA